MQPDTQTTQQQPMSADQAAASLAFATSMQDHFLTNGQGIQTSQKQPAEGFIEPQKAPEEAETPKQVKDESGMEERIMSQIEDLKSQIDSNRQQDELDAIRQELTDLLKEDGE